MEPQSHKRPDSDLILATCTWMRIQHQVLFFLDCFDLVSDGLRILKFRPRAIRGELDRREVLNPHRTHKLFLYTVVREAVYVSKPQEVMIGWWSESHSGLKDIPQGVQRMCTPSTPGPILDLIP